MSAAALALAAAKPTVHLTSQTRIIAAVIAIAFMLLILELIRRDRLQERYSVIWLRRRPRRCSPAPPSPAC